MPIILLIALILRLVLINQSLWLDESIEALALMGRMGPLLQYALADFQPPLYHFIGYFFTQLFGYSEIALRLPSLLSGLFTVYFVIKLGELLGGKKLGIVAGLLAATNPLLIYYSQEGRTYAMTAFFVTASFYYFIELLKEKSTLSTTIYYLLSTTAFLWTSYLSWFVLLSQGIYVLWKKRSDLLGVQALSALTLIFWLPSLISSLGIGHSTLLTTPEWGRVVGGLSWKSLPLTWVKFVLGRISFDNKLLYAVLVGCLGLTHLFVLRLVRFKRYPLLLTWLILPVLLGLSVSIFLPVYAYFRVLFVLPAYLLLLALALVRQSQKYTLAVVIFQLAALGYFWIFPRFHREDWRALVRDLPASAVLAMPSRAQDAPLRYYGITAPIIEPSHEQIVGEQIYYIRYVEDLFDSTRLGQANFAKSGYTITKQRVYSGIQLDIYENHD